MIDIRERIAANRAGEITGLPSFCTANGHVLRTLLAHAAGTGAPVLIEATCNQVNQDGGYTGMTPRDFMDWIGHMAGEAGLRASDLVIGGDHLGPNPWRHESPERAMDHARTLVRDYVEAGFTKIHLDASMPLGGEAPPSFARIAERAASLCAVAEAHAPDPSRLVYVIGTEVPVPGGETEEPDALDVTSEARLAETIATHGTAWRERNLDEAWARIVAVVTQPGVDFGHSSVFVPDLVATRPLGEAILATDGLCHEAHSTDYQPDAVLRGLVRNHYFFLKVGPELTFRFREAVCALADIEAALRPKTHSGLPALVERRMIEHDRHWRDYYRGSDAEVALLRRYSYSDRIRYYWTDPEIETALGRMLEHLQRSGIPETLVSRHFPGYGFGEAPRDPRTLIADHVLRCVRRYLEAAGVA